MAGSLTIDELDDATLEWIDQEAQRSGVPVAAVVRHLIHQGMVVERKNEQCKEYHDLDALAGTWTAEDEAEFLRAVEDFDQVDPALWQ